MSNNPFDRRNQSQQGTFAQDQAPRANANANRRPPSSGFVTCGIIAGIVLALGVIAAICCGGLAYFGYGMMEEPVNAATAAMEEDQEIAEALGTPIESTSTIGARSIEIENSNGRAEVEFAAKGPKGRAGVSGEMTMDGNVWSVEKLKVKMPDGSTVTLPRGQKEPDDAEKDAEVTEENEFDEPASDE